MRRTQGPKICQDQEICPASDDLYAGPQDKMKHEISSAVCMFIMLLGLKISFIIEILMPSNISDKVAYVLTLLP